MAKKPSKTASSGHPKEVTTHATTSDAEAPGMSAGEAFSRDALHDSEERLRAILQTAVEGIITIDEMGIIESMNPAAEKTFGWKAAEVIGKNVSVLMPTPYRQEHDGYLHNYRATGHARIIGIGREVVGRRKDGSVFPMDLAVSEVGLAGRRLFTGFVRDISERKRAELRQAELTQTLAEISDRERQRIGQDLHDGICQQLAGIELMSQVLQQKLEGRSKADAARAGDIASCVRETISQTRSLARGLAPSTLQSDGLMSALEELAVNTEKMFGVSCHFECPSPAEVPDLAVATHLYRIAQEAVSNAIKHGRAKNILITLESSHEFMKLRIRDDGKGFPPAPVPGRSEGMGLRIMQYRAGVIGGTVAIQANKGRGTTIVCSRPADGAKRNGGPS
jgi:two-component system CheB/CheR fusion protein